MRVLEDRDDDLLRVLDEDGRVVDERLTPDLDDETLLEIHEQMVFARRFDGRAVKLQRQGRLGTYPPMAGQEAGQIGSAHALENGDRVVPSYREMAAMFARGVPAENVLAYWMGDERGNANAEHDVFPVSVPIGTQVPHATGLAWGDDMKGRDKVTMCYFGEGATSEGDFHEGLNFAGVFEVPAVYQCNNNQYAISVPRERQTASETIARKADAYGVEGVRVDGMDPLASYVAARDAVELARSERRPTLIESVQYRYGAHTTADDPTKYRDESEVERWRRLDPIERFRTYLERTGRLDTEAMDALERRVETRLEQAVDAAEALEPPEVEDAFEHVYDEMPEELERQSDVAGRYG
ncbi:MAG: pyruvate dehydrogenase (acetyl-transferring) E1 component subunit alpha [Halobacteriales archaeon]